METIETEELFRQGLNYYNSNNYLKALECFTNIEDYAPAKYMLGKCYEYGQGVEKDLEKAFNYYKRSSEYKFNLAEIKLGIWYFDGIFVDKNLITAYYYFKRQASNNDEIAQYCLANCYYYGYGVDINKKQALAWLKRSAKLNCVYAEYDLAIIYQVGINVDENYIAAAYWYKCVADYYLKHHDKHKNDEINIDDINKFLKRFLKNLKNDSKGWKYEEFFGRSNRRSRKN